jgi:hypothetical protein
LDSLPSLFDSLPPLSSSSHHTGINTAAAAVAAAAPNNNNTLSSPQLFLSHTSATIGNGRDSFYGQPQQQSTSLPTAGGSTGSRQITSSSSFGMGVDGRMRRVPSKDEAYDMLQSLLLYYEQDNSYLGEQQTLLLPRWIHQQRQIMSQQDENDVRMLWMKHQQFQQQQQQQQQQTLSHPHSNYPRSAVSPPPMPPITTFAGDSTSPVKMTTSTGTSTSLDREETASSSSVSTSHGPAGLGPFGSVGNHDGSNNNSNPSSQSLTSSIEQQMLLAHQQQLQQQYALHQQHQQQQQQQQQHSSYLSQRSSSS